MPQAFLRGDPEADPDAGRGDRRSPAVRAPEADPVRAAWSRSVQREPRQVLLVLLHPEPQEAVRLVHPAV